MNKKANRSEKARAFYREALEILDSSKIPFLLAGAFALREYTGIHRDTKDLDIFCLEKDYFDIIKVFEKNGYEVEITDPRWLAKVRKDDYFVDLIWGTASNIYMVDDTWFDTSTKGEVMGVKLRLIGAEEMVMSKLFVQNRERYDGADVNHVFLRYGKKLDWERLYKRMGAHWPLLLEQFVQFVYIYPADRDLLPKDMFFRMMEQLKEHYSLPIPETKVCRGPLIDHTQYKMDIEDWGYKAMTIFSI